MLLPQTAAANGHHAQWPADEKRPWINHDDKWRRGGDTWLANGFSSVGRLIEGTSVKEVVGRILGVPSAELELRTSRPAPPSFSLPSIATVRFVLLCGLWYMSSALSSNTGKAIMTRFRYPVTLTFVQFGFVAGYCLLFASPIVRFTHIRTPSMAILRSTFPMALFQVGGHIFSSMAISRIPVSTVHTIKALSPLFTVAAYAMLFGVSYSAKTYLSLLPLTAGVMLACSFDVSASNVLGLICAFGSALVFVSSNIFFKKIMPSPSAAHGPSGMAHKLDKLNLLFYSSGLAFIVMIPIWIYSDVGPLLSRWSSGAISHPNTSHSHSVTYYFFLNGTVHWAQNIIAFAILASTSPVTYSIASLVKRIAVIVIAILWFRQTVHPIQAFGIALTFGGLWMYNNAKSDVERGEKKMQRVEAARDLALPSTKAETSLMDDGAEAVSSAFLSRAYSITATTAPFPGALAHDPTAAPQVKLPPLRTQFPPAALQAQPPITRSSLPRITVASPTDEPYPSPPLSHDSPPPLSTIPLPPQVNIFTRRAHDARSMTPISNIAETEPSTVTRQLPLPAPIVAQ